VETEKSNGTQFSKPSYCKPNGAFTPGTPNAKRLIDDKEARFPRQASCFWNSENAAQF
jgi:hypothetical protein